MVVDHLWVGCPTSWHSLSTLRNQFSGRRYRPYGATTIPCRLRKVKVQVLRSWIVSDSVFTIASLKDMKDSTQKQNMVHEREIFVEFCDMSMLNNAK